MIHPALLKKYLKESWGLLLACCLGLLLFGWMFVYMICQFDTRFLEAVFRRLPAVFEGLLPVPIEQLASFEARLSILFDHPIVLFLVALWCVSRSSDVVAGELDRGTLELLLAQPLRREQLVWSSTVITLLGVTLLTLLLWLGIALGIATTRVDRTGGAWQLWPPAIPATPGPWALTRPFGQPSSEPPGDGTSVSRIPLSHLVKGRQFAPAVSNTISLGVFLCGLGTLLSSCNRYRWRTIGMLTGFVVVQLMIELLGKTAPSLAWVRWLTIFRAYDPAGFVIQGLRDPPGTWSWWQATERGSGLGVLGANAVLLALGAACLWAAEQVFRRRDIPAPL